MNNEEQEYYYDYDETVCPICGGEIMHPITGSVTTEQLEEQNNKCTWIEVIDEEGYTLGYQPICKNIHINKNRDGGVTINLLEILNVSDSSLDSKFEMIYGIVKHYKPNVKKDDIRITLQGDKIVDVTIIGCIEQIQVTLSINEDGAPILV